MLVSVHMPKTAGTSFLQLLKGHYGDALLPDYADLPLNRGRWQRRSAALSAGLRNLLSPQAPGGVECIHGHFLPLKYRPLSRRSSRYGSVRYVTWLRDPVERLASHYYYWRRRYVPAEAGALHRRVVEEDWDLERFCLGPELQNTYCEFLWGFPLRRFDFVGITEHFAEDLQYFARQFLGVTAVDLSSEQVNANTSRPERGSYIDDPSLYRAVRRHHARDVSLYRQALALRTARLGGVA